MSFVGMAFSESCARKRLTRTTGGPDLSFAWPSGEPKGNGPSRNASKEMTLVVAFDVAGFDVDDGSLVNISSWNESSFNKCSQPGTGFWIDFIIVKFHRLSLGSA